MAAGRLASWRRCLFSGWRSDLSVYRAERHEVDGRAGDGDHLEKLAHLACPFAGQTIDGGSDQALFRRLLVLCENRCAFGNAEPVEKLALTQAAIDVDAGCAGNAAEILEIHMARQVGFAGMGECRIEIMVADRLQRIAEARDHMAVVDDDGRAAMGAQRSDSVCITA